MVYQWMSFVLNIFRSVYTDVLNGDQAEILYDSESCGQISVQKMSWLTESLRLSLSPYLTAIAKSHSVLRLIASGTWL